MAGRAVRTAGMMALAAVTTMACAKKDDNIAADTTAATNAANTTAASDTGAGSTASTTPAASAGWSDANIFAFLDAANVADSSEGAVAATKGTSAQVRDFGKQMMRDHHAMRVEGQTLAKKLAVTPQPASDDNTQSDAQKSLDKLNSTAKGKDFDKAYIDMQVDDHKTVLEKATKAMAATQTTELKNLIQKASPKVQSHLDKAEAIQKSMK